MLPAGDAKPPALESASAVCSACAEGSQWRVALEIFRCSERNLKTDRTGWGPQDSVQLPYQWLKMVDIIIVTGSYFMVYKPTYIWGAPSCKWLVVMIYYMIINDYDPFDLCILCVYCVYRYIFNNVSINVWKEMGGSISPKTWVKTPL